MQTEQNEKKCENCKFFSRHYGIRRERLFALNCGYCFKAKISKTRLYKDCDNVCGSWEIAETDKDETNEIIKKLCSECQSK